MSFHHGDIPFCLVKILKTVQVYNTVFNFEDILESTLGKASLNWHLTTFKPGWDCSAGSGFSAFVTTSSLVSCSGTLSFAEALLSFIFSGSFQIT
jgi:hypothetical protein